MSGHIDVEKIKRQIIENMSILKNSLYDENGNLYDAKLFGGGEADRQGKINLLKDYENKLTELNNGKFPYGEPIYGKVSVLKLKDIPKEVQNRAEQSANTLYNVPIKGNDGVSIINFQGINSQMQYPDGTYHNTVVFYKGFSTEFNTDFIVYLDDNKVICTPVVMKDGFFMKNPEHSPEMIRSFEKQLLNQDSQVINPPSVPTVMRCSSVEQYETIEQDVIIGWNPPVSTQVHQQLPPEGDNNNNKGGAEKMYSYLVVGYNIDIIPTLETLKFANPGVIISAETIEGEMPYDKNSVILKTSIPKEKLNLEGVYIPVSKGRNHVSGEGLASQLKSIKYDEFISKYNPQFSSNLSEKFIEEFVGSLKQSNPECSINYEYDKEKEAYKLISSTPLSELKPLEDACKVDGRQIAYQYGFDKDGYIFSQNQKLVKYELDEQNNCQEKRPYYVEKYIVDKIKESSKNTPNNETRSSIKENMPLINELIEMTNGLNDQLKESNEVNREQMALMQQQIQFLMQQNMQLQQTIEKIANNSFSVANNGFKK